MLVDGVQQIEGTTRSVTTEARRCRQCGRPVQEARRLRGLRFCSPECYGAALDSAPDYEARRRIVALGRILPAEDAGLMAAGVKRATVQPEETRRSSTTSTSR